MTTTKNTEVTIHAKDIARLRDEEQMSWAKVASALGLGSPGAARRAYTALVKPHRESILAGSTRNARTMKPLHLDGADLEAIKDLITEQTIVVQRKDGTEDMYVAKITSIKGDTINVHDGTKARSLRVESVIGFR